MTLKLSNIHFILLAAGKSTRFKSKENKLLTKIEDKTILEHNIELLRKIGFKKITLVIKNKSILKNITATNIESIKGGKTRTMSVKNALTKSKIKAKYVFIHDAARILNSDKILKKLIKETYKEKYDCIIPFSKCNDTVIKNHKNIIREELKFIKTPQVFLKNKIILLHKNNKIKRNIKSAIIKYCINSASLTISFEAIREYTVSEKRTINIARSIVAENLLKYFDIKFI